MEDFKTQYPVFVHTIPMDTRKNLSKNYWQFRYALSQNVVNLGVDTHH
jgi:hypothetical protein